MADSLVLEVPTIGERTFIRSRPGDRLRQLYGQELVLIKAEDLEAGWSMAPNYRQRKIEQFTRFLAESAVIEVANVHINAGGRIAFRDGQHRTRVLLNLGMEAIPVTMPTDSLDRFERCYT